MIKRKLFLIIFIYILFQSFSLYPHTIYPVDDFFSISKNTVGLQKKDILPLTAFIGISALLFWQDENLTEYVQQTRSPGMDQVFKYAQYFGNGWYLLPAAGLTIIAGETVLNRKYTFLGAYMIEGFIISGIFVSGVKVIAGRARPYKNSGPYKFKPFSFKNDYYSFYSGHSTEAFTFASVIAHFLKMFI